MLNVIFEQSTSSNFTKYNQIQAHKYRKKSPYELQKTHKDELVIRGSTLFDGKSADRSKALLSQEQAHLKLSGTQTISFATISANVTLCKTTFVEHVLTNNVFMPRF